MSSAGNRDNLDKKVSRDKKAKKASAVKAARAASLDPVSVLLYR